MENGGGQPRRITRNRDFRSCTECRTRKLKCDRLQPCSACLRRSDAADCFYTPRRSNGSAHQEYERARRVQAESRLEHLEQLVQQLSESREDGAVAVAGQPNGSGATEPVKGNGNAIPAAALPHGATHWSAMLEDIEELRNSLSESEQTLDLEGHHADAEQDAMSLLSGTMEPLSLEQVLERYLPSRERVDRIVNFYFRNRTSVAPFIHTEEFRRFYSRLWVNPTAAPALRISLLFSILHIVVSTNASEVYPTMSFDGTNEKYDVAAAHCLRLGQFHKPQKFVLEALILFMQSKILDSVDISPDVAVLTGLTARLALVMGYHRDADFCYPRLSPFEAEMRRRTFSMFMQLDIMVAFSLGLPTCLQSHTWDTRPPTNVRDSDFDEDTVKLPEERPTNEHSELLFYISKHKMMAVLEKVVSHSLAVSGGRNEDVDALDRELRQTYAGLPAVFHSRDMADSIVDSPAVMITRLCVGFIYGKSLCALHKKHIMRGRQKSLATSYRASSDVVEMFLDVYPEFEPGGKLETEMWFMSSISWHDFLLGCVTLCLVVYSARNFKDTTVVNVSASLVLLQRALELCKVNTHRSTDTGRVMRLLEVTTREFANKRSSEERLERQLSRIDIALATPHGDDISFDPVTPSASGLGWDYIEQFLNLPDDEFMVDL